MSKPTIKITRRTQSEQVLNAFVEVVRPNLPLELKNTRITAEDIIAALAYANVHRLSIAAACQELQGAPSGNRLREALVQALPDRAGLQCALNKMFHQQLHPSLLKGKRDYNFAIDLTLIPYHGQPYQDKKEIVRGASKSGTTHFHGYATVSIVRDNRRYVVALRFIEYGEEMADIVRWLIERLKTLKFRIRRVFLDKGFCSKPVFQVLNQHNWHLSYSTFTSPCARTCLLHSKSCQNRRSVPGYPCAAWRSCSVVLSNGYGALPMCSNTNLALRFRELLIPLP